MDKPWAFEGVLWWQRREEESSYGLFIDICPIFAAKSKSKISTWQK
jgi:hypothetical protein